MPTQAQRTDMLRAMLADRFSSGHMSKRVNSPSINLFSHVPIIGSDRG
jgi:hypothetical protein